MKRIIGAILLLLVFAVLIYITASAHGWANALIAWALAFALTVIAVSACLLMSRSLEDDNDEEKNSQKKA